MREILDKLKADFEFYTGQQYIGLIKAIGAGFASRLSEFHSKLKFIEKQAFIASSNRDYLYLHSGKLLPPKAAEVASGHVVFFGEAGKTIPIGTTIKDAANSYTTTADGTIALAEITGVVEVNDGIAKLPAQMETPSCACIVNGRARFATSTAEGFTFKAEGLSNGEAVIVAVNKTPPVPVRADEAGQGANRSLSDTLKNKVTIAGINKEAGVVAIEGGADAENVEAYRARVNHWMANPQAPFNENNIRAVLLESIPTLKYVWVKGGEVQNGRVKVFLLNKEDSITEKEKERAEELTKAIRPVQLSPNFIEIKDTIIKTTDVVIRGLMPNNQQMQEEVKKSIEYLFSKDMYEKGMSTQEIESIVYRTERNGERVTSFDVVSGQCDVESHTFWKLNTVTFE